MENKESNIQVFEFEGTEISFELFNRQKMMVNATEMAKNFGKDVPDFLILKQTKEFIAECLKNQNSGFLGIENQEDLYTSKQKSGTWMHRILALKFAAWLNPAFDLWIILKIEEILSEAYEATVSNIKEKAELETEIQKQKTKLLNESQEYRDLVESEARLNQAKARGRKIFGTMKIQFKSEIEETDNQENKAV